MLRPLGPSGLLRLATAMEADEGSTRCYPDHSTALTVVCLQP